MGLAIVGVTAFYDNEIVEAMFKSGMVDAVQKPISNSKMEEIIRQYYFHQNSSSSSSSCSSGSEDAADDDDGDER